MIAALPDPLRICVACVTSLHLAPDRLGILHRGLLVVQPSKNYSLASLSVKDPTTSILLTCLPARELCPH